MSNRVPTSSPLSSVQSSQATFKTASSQSKPQYRSALTLPFELLQHVQIYLEENLFSQALRFLLGLISATSANEKKKVPVPPPEYLAVISTLTVHPSLTTRASTQDKLLQSNTALRLLWTIQRTTGPANSRVTEAYRFCRYDDRDTKSSSQDDDDAWRGKLNLTYAEGDSLFSLGKDFWAVVGWALNCSCLPGPHATRWAYWSAWLDYMLDVLEIDWAIREELGTCDKSLLWEYIVTADGGNVRGRRILRAVFADGHTSALNEFHEVFRKELKGPKSEKIKAEKQKVAVDVDEEIYGDWMQESESTSDEEKELGIDTSNSRPSKRLRTWTPGTRHRLTSRKTRTLATDNEDSDTSGYGEKKGSHGLGPPESIGIRLRLLQLLSTVSARSELTSSAADRSFTDLHELYTLYVEFIRPLSLPVFQQFILPSITMTGLHSNVRTALCEHILQRMVDNEHVSRLSTFEPLSLDRLAEDYLPFSGLKNSIEVQAKVSLLLESLLRQMIQDGKLVTPGSESLRGALEQGIIRRSARVSEIRDSTKHKKASGREEDGAWEVMEESSMRMRFMFGTSS